MIPVLKENVRIKEEPQGAVFINTVSEKYTLASSFEAFILSLFDGTRSIEEVASLLKNLKNSPEERKIQNDILILVHEKREIIELIKSPLKKSRIQIDPYRFLLKPDIFKKPMRCNAPLAVDLYITRKCNLNCIYCFANAKYTDSQTRNYRCNEMRLDRINYLIDQIAELETKKIILTGGEPTLRPDLPKIIQRLSNYGIDVFLATNVYSMNDKLAKELRDSGLTKIQAKLDAANPKIQDKLSRVKGSYGKLIRGIKTLKKYSFKISVVSIATSWNIKEIPEVVKICADLGIDEFNPRIYTPGIWALHGRGGSYLNPSSNSILWLYQRIEELQEEYKGIMNVSSLETSTFCKKKENEVPACPGFISACTILENGLVVPCELVADFSNDFIIGDANKQPLIDIWNSEKAERWMLRKYPKIGEPCSSCNEFERCKGGCPAKSFIAYGKRSADPFCVKAPNPTVISFPEVSTE
ncbi:MAG: radical SAM protein [Candidatus Methanoperedens sp.]|nr:radical SAM protein [Candidatus Methanoperedens sp.]